MLNVAILTGRITHTLELQKTTSGLSVLSFSIAVERNYRSGEEKQVDFINCVAWRNTAEFIERYFGKGDTITVKGEIQTRKYQDRNGNDRTAYEINVNEAYFCGKKSDAEPETANTEDFAELGDGELDGDLPF